MSQIQKPHFKRYKSLSTWNVSQSLIWAKRSLWRPTLFFFLRRLTLGYSRVTYTSLNMTSEFGSLSLSWSYLHNKGSEASNATHKTFSSSNVKWGLSPIWYSKCLCITATYHDMFFYQAAEQNLSGRCSNRNQGCSHSPKYSHDSRSHTHWYLPKEALGLSE